MIFSSISFIFIPFIFIIFFTFINHYFISGNLRNDWSRCNWYVIFITFNYIYNTFFNKKPPKWAEINKRIKFWLYKESRLFLQQDILRINNFLSTNNHFVNSLLRIYKYVVKFILFAYLFISFIFLLEHNYDKLIFSNFYYFQQ